MNEQIGSITLHEPGDIWVFAYGSLMWDPGFECEERVRAQLHGYHRAFCVNSPDHRGTPDQPGLVLGLVPGGSCRGFALRVAEEKRREVMLYLEAREMPVPVYHCKRLPVVFEAGLRIDAYAFLVNPQHQLYSGKLPVAEIAERILNAAGKRGPNRTYLDSTVRHLEELGLADTRIHAIHRAVEKLARAS
jgi:cation transport protein ChaC